MLGICLGLQWLFEGSAEAPGHPGLELPCRARARLITDERRRVGGVQGAARGLELAAPHLRGASWLLDGVGEGDQVYFTHSYAAPVNAELRGVDPLRRRVRQPRSSAAHVGGVQFHPEKSSDVGLRILAQLPAPGAIAVVQQGAGSHAVEAHHRLPRRSRRRRRQGHQLRGPAALPATPAALARPLQPRGHRRGRDPRRHRDHRGAQGAGARRSDAVAREIFLPLCVGGGIRGRGRTPRRPSKPAPTR